MDVDTLISKQTVLPGVNPCYYQLMSSDGSILLTQIDCIFIIQKLVGLINCSIVTKAYGEN
jgi:hypothetical protein